MQNISKPLQKQCGALVLKPYTMICTMTVITLPWISHIIFLWYPRMSVVPFPAVSQRLLPRIFWAATASTSLPSVMDNWWAPISHWKFLLLVSMLTTLLGFALSTIKCHFMSITPNQQSNLNSFHVIIWSSSVLTIPPKFLSFHTWAHTQTLHTGQSRSIQQAQAWPKQATPPISLHPDDFLWIPLSIQTTLFACNGRIFSLARFFSTFQFLSWTTIFILSHNILWGMVSHA